MNQNYWCRDCEQAVPICKSDCPVCGSARVLHHEEAIDLYIAHLDCDAFFASVEKRDRPELASKPVLIGGTGPRAVVSTACYLARAFGARSAMPMAKAKKLCPQAIIVRPEMKKYVHEGQILRQMMRDLSPLVEPLSIDEAFMDLSGTSRIHAGPPVQSLIRLQNRIEKERGITVSIGLSHNKFLAKSASDMNKPRGFSFIGKKETQAVLDPLPVTFVYGVGPAFGDKLMRDGFYTLSQVRGLTEAQMSARYGESGYRLARLARGQDNRKVNPVSVRKSISTETTFDRDIADLAELERILWRCCEKVSAEAKAKNMAGYTLVLKLKNAKHQTKTRSVTFDAPVQLGDTLFRVLQHKLRELADGTRYRLIGAGLGTLDNVGEDYDEPVSDLIDHTRVKRAKVEKAMDKARARFGKEIIGKGRSIGKK